MNVKQLFQSQAKSTLEDGGALQTAEKYPVFNRIVAAYVAVVLVFQVLFLISPVLTFFSKTPLYSMQTYLGLLGGVLIVIDVLTNKVVWKGANCLLLYGICVLAALASVRMIAYGVKENLFKLCWAGIQMALMYSCAYRMSREQLRKCLWYLYAVITAIWVVACCVSLYQYIAQIGYTYLVNPLAQDSSVTRQGFYDNRLFGIFYTLNHAAFVSLFLFLMGLIYLIANKGQVRRVLLCLSEVVLSCHIILSGSRSTMVAMMACLLCLFWALFRNRFKSRGWRTSLMALGLSLLCTGVCVLGFQGAKKGLSHIPELCEQITVPGRTNGQDKEEDPAEEEDLLRRKNLEDDASNGRLSIWKDYVGLYREVGPIGLSPGNYMNYIMENHAELYIVEYIRENYPDKYDSGIIYHVHSGYLMVFVSAGILGVLLLVVFVVLCLRRVIGAIGKNRRLSYVLIGAFMIVAAGAISAVFDEGLFFQNNPHTTMFWIALGILMKEAAEPGLKTAECE